MVDEQGYWTPKGGSDWGPAVLVKRLRLMRGMTQRDLAAKAGVVQSHVSKTEAGADVHASTLTRLVEALGCRLALRVRPVVPFEVR